MNTLKVFLCLFFSFSIFCFSEMPLCYKSLQTGFFNPKFVDEALSMHLVSQSNWSLINNQLQTNVGRIPEILKERAQKMDPNPFGSHFQPQIASELLRQALFEVFSQTLAGFYITNQEKVEEMFQYIRERQSQRFLSCLGDETKEK